MIVCISGCGSSQSATDGSDGKEPAGAEQTGSDSTQTDSTSESDDAQTADAAAIAADPIQYESAADGQIDFEALKAQNPEIFAWIYIPGTAVDQPILLNEEDDTYYKEHDAYGNPGGSAAFVEFPNRTDFCDFNEIIYEVDAETVHSLANPDNFDKAENIEIFIEGNHMTYEVVMARKWERVDLLTQYAFPSPIDAENFLRDCKDTMSLADNISSVFDNLTSRDFIITLVTYPEDDPANQFMVIARLINDEQGTIKTPEGEIPGVTF